MTSAATHRFVFFLSISLKSAAPSGFWHRSALDAYGARGHDAGGAGGGALAAPYVSFSSTKAMHSATRSSERWPCLWSDRSRKEIGSTACSSSPLSRRRCTPPCSLSSTTTTSVTSRPDSRRGSTVSITEAPLVTRSSTTRQRWPASKEPSISFFVPYALASFRRITMPMPDCRLMAVAIGSAVYGTPQRRSGADGPAPATPAHASRHLPIAVRSSGYDTSTRRST